MNEENKNLLSDSITSNYMLVNVTVRTYGGQRTDKSISDEVHATHNASSSTGKYVRNLFGDKCKRLKEVSTAYNSLRNFLYSRSLPWVSDNTGGQHGDRLMPVTESLQFLADFGKKKDEAIALRKSNWKAGTTAQQNLIHQQQTDWYKVMHITEQLADRAPIHEKYVLHLQPLGDTTAPTTYREIGSVNRVTPDEPTI